MPVQFQVKQPIDNKGTNLAILACPSLAENWKPDLSKGPGLGFLQSSELFDKQ